MQQLLTEKEKKIMQQLASPKNGTHLLTTDRLQPCGLRLPALMDLYIHPLYVLVSKMLSSILNSPAPIHPLYHPLSTLSTMGLTCHFI
jgi:hypothetical protein